MTPPGEPRLIDARGHHCPVPSLRLRRVLDEAAPGELLRLLADDPMARIDVPHLLAQRGDELVSLEAADEGLTFTVRKRPAP